MDKDVFILKALLAQQGSRHFEMAGEVIDAIRRYGVDIQKMPRSLLIESYTNVMSELKLALRELLQHQKSGVQNSNQVQANVYNIIEVSDNIEAYSRAVLHLVGQYLLPIKDLDNESKIVYLNLRGDCFRSLAEILTKKQNKLILDSAVLAYSRAYDMATEGMNASNPIRVQVALSYSSFANDLLDDTKSAYQIAFVAFTDAQAELNDNTSEVLKQNTLLGKLYDSVIQWRKILSQIKRSEFVERAMLSREMKRYNTMAATMKNLIKATNTMNLQEGKLFSEAFQKLVDQCKLSREKVTQKLTLPNLTENQKHITTIYILNISRELRTLCYTVLKLISKHILNNELMIDQDTKIFFMNMKSKYFKYMSEVSKRGELELNQCYGDNVEKAYTLGQEMQPTNSIRLEATLNLAIFVADNINEPGTAYQICNIELRELGIHEKEVEDLNIVPKMHYYMNIWNMKQQKKFSSLCELTTKEYTRFKYLDLALIAENSKRYLDMAVAVKNLINVNRRLDSDERDMFNLVFKKLVDERRKSLGNLRDTENGVPVVESKKAEKDKLRLNIIAQEYRNKIKEELEFLCWYTIHLLNTLLSIDDIGNYPKLYYLRMKGDFYRYLSEIGESTRHDTIRNALNAYKDAYEIAMSTMSPVDAYRLELMVNYAVFLYDIMDDKRNAASMLRQALRDIGNKEIEDSIVSDIVEKIERNISRWFFIAVQKDSMPEKDGLQHKDNFPKENDLQQENDVLQNNAQQKQKDNSQKKDNKPQKGNFQAKTIVPPTKYFLEEKSMSQEVSLPPKRNVLQTDNMSEKGTVSQQSQQDLPGKNIVSQKDKFPAEVSVSQTDNLSKKNTVPQAGISLENANGSVNRNVPEKDKSKLKEKPPVKPPKETKQKKKTKKKKIAHKKKK